ncbi:hypothetical protein [Segniliparus rugosus]|uniref:Uncharacterized protein n=1 Tax=Segniliparus rugosus (strain ATCC BAA-974 / DSM 45345 / CCUG 50838 / CIP 108380 / JCM 13579 / CDC 945) TaxID=679197 RepID=E5XTN7_SEGRC|nr:hypothetical protein [Segniliparus rugosus]EFV12299.2 hypothetical protein HMPREF9336_02859 [Segniliparus rugosus ATCC BAA-974]
MKGLFVFSAVGVAAVLAQSPAAADPASPDCRYMQQVTRQVVAREQMLTGTANSPELSQKLGKSGVLQIAAQTYEYERVLFSVGATQIDSAQLADAMRDRAAAVQQYSEALERRSKGFASAEEEEEFVATTLKEAEDAFEQTDDEMRQAYQETCG